jgi:hypothetical protein
LIGKFWNCVFNFKIPQFQNPKILSSSPSSSRSCQYYNDGSNDAVPHINYLRKGKKYSLSG